MSDPERLALDLNADPGCLLKAQIGDFVWVDRTLYEVYGFEGNNALLRWSEPLRMRQIPWNAEWRLGCGA